MNGKFPCKPRLGLSQRPSGEGEDPDVVACATSSLLIQITVVPFGTVSVSKLKSRMLDMTGSGGRSGIMGGVGFGVGFGVGVGIGVGIGVGAGDVVCIGVGVSAGSDRGVGVDVGAPPQYVIKKAMAIAPASGIRDCGSRRMGINLCSSLGIVRVWYFD